MSKIEFPDCPICGSSEVDIGRGKHGTKVYGCWTCGYEWPYTPYKGKTVVLKPLEGQEIPVDERHLFQDNMERQYDGSMTYKETKKRMPP